MRKPFISYVLIPVLIILSAGSCQESKNIDSVKSSNENAGSKHEKVFTINSLEIKKQLKSGDTLRFQLFAKQTIIPDSVSVRVSNRSVPVRFNDTNLSCVLATETLPLGINTFTIKTYFKGNQDVNLFNVTLVANKKPVQRTYTLVNKYQHNTAFFTQGLIFYQGDLYESTGQWGESVIVHYDKDYRSILKQIDIASNFFGEGIAVKGKELYQLTWRSQVGFVYNIETFEEIRKIYYNAREGWGLTFDGQNFIMSDGSNRLFFLDPEYFTEVHNIQVYNHIGPVNQLNELEYVNGKIYANVLYSSVIVVIDPQTGQVLEEIDCSALMPADYKERSENVLNGIAFNPMNNHFFITGKYWNTLFELELNQ